MKAPKKFKNAPPRKSAMVGTKTGGKMELDVLLGWLNFSLEAAEPKHWEYFVIDQFLRGNHNIRGNPQDNSIVVGRRSEQVSFPINKIYATSRAVRAFVTRHKPVAGIETTESTDEAKVYARRANKLLERDNFINNSRKLNKEWVYYGVNFGLGWRQIGYDKQRKCAIRWTIDPNDLLVGSKSGNPLDSPYLIKCLTRTVGYWKNKYPDSNVVPDNELAASRYKKLSMELNGLSNTDTRRLEEQTALGYECWYRLFDKNGAGGYINKCLFTKTEVISFEETPYEEYPFIPYTAEILPNESIPDGHLKHVIAPQRLYNLLNAQMLEYNHIVNRGRIIKEKNAGFKVIRAVEGQIIEVNPGKRVELLNPPALNPSMQWQINLADSAIEDIGGQHDASQGSTPERVSSGRAIESLQQGDSNNISDLRDNFEDALAMEATWVLKMYSLFEDEGVVMTDVTGTSEKNPDRFAVVGEQAYQKAGKAIPEKYFIEDDGTYCATCPILPDNKVKVSVTSQLGETREARMDLLFKLLEAGLPLKVLLDHLEFPNTSDILERIASESIAETMIQRMGQPGSAPPGEVPSTGPGTGGLTPPGGPGVPPSPDEETMKLMQLNQRAGGLLNG